MGGSERGVNHLFKLACIYTGEFRCTKRQLQIIPRHGKKELPGSVDMFCTFFLYLHYQITILSETTKVGPVAAILCVRAVTHYMMSHGTTVT